MQERGIAMRYTKLGKTDIEISKVCVGCMSFGKTDCVAHSKQVTDEEQTCCCYSFTGNRGSVAPHPACGHLPPAGKGFSIFTFYLWTYLPKIRYTV